MGENIYHLVVFYAINGTVISSREYLWGGETERGQRALLINSAGTSGFVMDKHLSGFGNRLFRYNPMSNSQT